MTSNNNSKKHWFALKVFYNKVFAIEELLLKKKIKCYIPCETVKVLKQDGTKKTYENQLFNSLLFFHSETYIAKEIQKILTDKVILYTRQIDFKKSFSHSRERDEHLHARYLVRRKRSRIF
mgnify:CR=1 FL=1